MSSAAVVRYVAVVDERTGLTTEGAVLLRLCSEMVKR